MENVQKVNIEGYEIGIYPVAYLEKIKGLYGFIYVTTNMVNGKMYVGQKKMRVDWKTYLGSGHAFLKAVKKYGRNNFDRKIIDVAFSLDELNYLENLYTRIFNSTNSRKWYNICYGGWNGAANYQKKPLKLFDINGNLMEIYDSLTSASEKTGESRDVIRNACNGKTIMTQNKHIWRWYDDEFNKYPTVYSQNKKSKKVKCYTFSGSLLKIYASMHDAEDDVDVARSSIKLCCDGKQNTAGGYVWRYFEDDFDKYPVKTQPDAIKEKLEKYSHKVKCYTANGILLKTYSSLHQAENDTGISRVNIAKCCNGKCYHAGGYVWRYLNDDFDKYPYREFKSGKVYRYDQELNFIDVYQNVNQASLLTGYARSSISRCCNGKTKSAYGDLWFYEDDPRRPH